MSASPTTPVVSSKRPFEDPSSPSAPTDQPDAKRPALDKIGKASSDPDETSTEEQNGKPSTAHTNGEAKADEETTNGVKDAQGDTIVADAPNVVQPITSAIANDSTTAHEDQQDETAWLHLRSVISSAEAATVIGKGGENVTLIRKLSGAKCTVSDYQRGAVERILTVSGAVSAVAKAFGLIIRTLNNEPLEESSTPQSRTYPLRLLIPHILIGSIIGKAGVRIREIQTASGARLNASDSTLPLSTERTLVILGVADAVHIATYYVGSTLLEQLTERFGGPTASAYATRAGGPAGVVPGGMQVIPYFPQAAGGSYGNPENLRRSGHRQHTPSMAYGQPYAQGLGPQQQAATPMHYGGVPVTGGYGGVGPQQPQQAGHAGPQSHAGPPNQPNLGGLPGQPLTQQIFIPNDMVGAIIGKGGAKINEIRQLSGSVIKINEPQDNSNERLVTITGTAECNQMALYMLYSRLESEKHRV